MPKTKKLEEESDSDSGPEDRNPPPKKLKPGEKDDGSKVDDEGKKYFELDRNRRVSMSTFKGKQYLNIREYYMDKGTGSWRPSKSGITLTKNEWQQLLDLQPKLQFEN